MSRKAGNQCAKRKRLIAIIEDTFVISHFENALPIEIENKNIIFRVYTNIVKHEDTPLIAHISYRQT